MGWPATITRFGEVPPGHSGDPDIRRIALMKGLQRTVAAGLVGGLAGSLMAATSFLAVNVLMPSSAEAQRPNEPVQMATPASIHEG